MENIVIHYFITFLGEHSKFNNVINALQCLFLASLYRDSWLITFEIFQNYFWTEGWVGGVYRIQTFFGFLYFLNIYKAPYFLFKIVAMNIVCIIHIYS